jgi:FdhE protein
MIWFSWDKRAKRAEELAAEYAACAEVLRFYAQVAHFQEGVYEKLKRNGTGAMQPDCLEAVFPPLLRLIRRIGPGALAAKAEELERERLKFSDIALADGPAVLTFFVRVLLQPYMEHRLNGTTPSAEGSPCTCPACGEKPQAAVLRGEGDGAKRWLVCSLCSREWEFRRVLCPACGEEDHVRLPVYTAAEFEHVRLEVCDGCRTYIKSIDLTKNGLAIPCVDELATVPLDLWAEEAGYTKLQRNIIGL